MQHQTLLFRHLLSFFLYFAVPVSLQAQGAHHIEHTADSVFRSDATIEAWLRENKVPVLGLGILKEGKLHTAKVYGELKTDVKAPGNTLFNVASLTKPVAAYVALMLTSQGKWDLNEPLYNYWIDPDLANDPRHKRLTTRIVLTHQTGFPNWRWMSESKKLAFEFDPGTRYQYSGEGFEYLKRAMEKKFGKTLDQLADSLIFQPLRMTDTRFFWNENTDEARFAIGYDTSGKAYDIYKRNTASAADDLLTTVTDYGTFLAAVMEGKGLSRNLFNEMVTSQVKRKDNKYFGLGFEKYVFSDGTYALSHGGADQGVKTLFFILPKSGQGLIIFTNVDDGYKLYEPLIRHYLGKYGQELIAIEMKQ